MNNSFVIIVAALAAVIALTLWYLRSRQQDQFGLLIAKRRATATIVSPAHLIDGSNHIPVALALEKQQISYENSDLDATLDLDQIDEVEYGSDLVNGGTANKGSVLRLRAHGRAIEFLLDTVSAEQWSLRLPPHRMNEAGAVRAV